ncbi:MAG: hypothetical protein KAS17_10340 [Victivallaceae bacterium]|nr:hypothetical protein [Victivallaceae bacterium]
MARKKRKRNKLNNKKNKIQITSIDALVNDLDNAIKAKRVRRAFSTAKQLVGHKDYSPQYVDFVSVAVEQKIVQMHQEGNKEQIASVYNSMLRKAPEIAEKMKPEIKILVLWNDPQQNVFDKYQIDEEITAQLDKYIATTLFDLSELTEYPVLAVDHSLKKTAETLLVAWDGVEKGLVDNPALTQMNKSISRRSPFLAWRLFINGLNACYENSTDNAMENLKRISADSPLYPIAQSLIHLIAEKKPQNELQTMIFKKLVQSDRKSKAEKLDALLKRDASHTQINQVLKEFFTPDFYEETPGLYTNLLAIFFSKVDDCSSPSKCIKFLIRNKTHNWTHAMHMADYMDKSGNCSELLMLVKEQSFPDIQKALIYDWCATLKSTKLNDDKKDDFFFFSRFKRKISKEQGKSIYDNELKPLWESSASLYPLPSVFEKWYSIAEYLCPSAQADKILEQWNSHFPDDESVLYKLITSCRKRKVFSKANAYLKRLEELVPGQNEVERLKEILPIETALNYYKKKKDKQAEKMIENFHTSPHPFIQTIQVILKNYVEFRSKKKKAKYTLDVLKQPTLAFYLMKTMQQYNVFLPGTAMLPLMKQLNDSRLYFSSLYTLLTIDDKIWGDIDLSRIHVPDNLKHIEKVSSESLCNIGQYFLNESTKYVIGSDYQKILWAVSREGIKRRDKFLAKFLILRASVLEWTASHNSFVRGSDYLLDKVLSVLAIADKLGREQNDSKIIRYIDEFLFSKRFSRETLNEVIEKLKQKKIDKIIKREINSEFSSFWEIKKHVPTVKFSKIGFPPRLTDYECIDDTSEYDDEYDDMDFNNSRITNDTIDELKSLIERFEDAIPI